MELRDRLAEFGLTEYEADVLVALVALGVGTAKDVAEVGDVPRSRVYDVAETLRDRGLVDVQYATPRRFTAVSRETLVGMLDRERRRTITEVDALLDDVTGTGFRDEGVGVWTVAGGDTVARRVAEAVEVADDEVAYLTAGDLLGASTLDALADAADRGVDVRVGDVSGAVARRVATAVPSVETFEVPDAFDGASVGRVVLVDGRRAVASVRAADGDEVAVHGSGDRNALVALVRATVAWLPGDDGAVD